MGLQDNETAVAAITQAEIDGNLAAARIIFDALDAHTTNLSPFDRHDFTLSTWSRFIDGQNYTDEQFVEVTLRAAAHLPDYAVIDLVDAQYGDREVRTRLDDERGLVWLPADEVLILSTPVGGMVADMVLGRRAA
jgi:hypothetical protein